MEGDGWMKNKEYMAVMQKILHMMDEGVHVVDANGNSVIYNDAMAALEKMRSSDVLRKPFDQVFKNLDQKESTIMQALHFQRETLKKEQTYLNKDGRQITTVNTTIPVMHEGEVISVIEIAKNITDIQQMSHTILELRKEIEEPQKAKERRIRKYSFANLYGQSKCFVDTIEIARKAARNSASVMIYGETGTGKELIAQSIHFDSARKNKPFLAQNCAALPASLLEGILFGTSKGGFTGALDRAGLFEQADGGTLLLDELNSMPIELQGKLLRVLQEDYIRRVGGSKDIPIDVRIIATVNENPETLIERGILRKDLYYRLAIISIDIPSLRERRDDILLLAEKFLDKHNRKQGKQVWMLSDQAKNLLLDYDYPGNVRELENIIMAAISMTEGEHVLSENYLLLGSGRRTPEHFSYDAKAEGMDDYLQRIEQNLIEDALSVCNRNISKAAEHLKIKRQTLQHKMRKYGIAK